MNKIVLNTIGVNTVRLNTVGEWRKSGGGGGGSISYPGLIAAWSAKGKSNDDEDRGILKDLTGNGHDISLNGFAFSEMSGYGGYAFDMNNIYLASWAIESTEKSYNKVICKKRPKNLGDYLFNGVNKGILNKSDISFTTKSFKLKITGLDRNEFIRLDYLVNSIKDGQLLWQTSNDVSTKLGNGEHIISSKEITVNLASAEEPIINVQFPRVFTSKADSSECKIEFEILPEYPDALVFDGVDDYGIINKDNPVLKDFTIITKRIYQNGNITGCLLSKYKRGNSCFSFESNGNNFGVFGSGNQIIYSENEIVYGTTKSYNGERSLTKGNDIDANYVQIKLGTFDDVRFSNFAFYSAYLFNRSLDEQEIKSFIRKYIDPEYLLPSEIPTPDCYYDFSKGSNDDADRNTIKDYSGNGNDAVAHGFAWNEEDSGYKDGALVFDGVDDYISLDAFDSGFKTMFMVCKPLRSNEDMMYDQRSVNWDKNFGIEFFPKTVAYVVNSIKPLYINNVRNTLIKCDELIDKKHLIHVITDDISVSRQPNLGRSLGNNLYANMALYKFLGFKEALTEEQIDAIIKKYNLLDGVDEIEVS